MIRLWKRMRMICLSHEVSTQQDRQTYTSGDLNIPPTAQGVFDIGTVSCVNTSFIHRPLFPNLASIGAPAPNGARYDGQRMRGFLLSACRQPAGSLVSGFAHR